ncbi:MAG TPA: hypothetical protein VNZ22_17760, partial [Bacillota bacterium]|nr:hypothetical protein [Bacillota bacterium]
MIKNHRSRNAALNARVYNFVAIGLLAAGGMPTGASAAAAVAPPGLALSQSAREEISALLEEKASWTPTQCKLESPLIHAAKKARGQAFAPRATHLETDVDILPNGLVLVDITGQVTPELLALIERGRGQVVASSPRFQALRALVAPGQLEALAGSADVKCIRRATRG